MTLGPVELAPEPCICIYIYCLFKGGDCLLALGGTPYGDCLLALGGTPYSDCLLALGGTPSESMTRERQDGFSLLLSKR